MAKTIVGLFDNSTTAETVATKLVDSGFQPEDVGIIMSDETDTDRAANLVKAGLPQEDAEYYAHGLERGQTLIAINAPDNSAQRAFELLNSYEASKVTESKRPWSELNSTSSQRNVRTTGNSQLDVNGNQVVLPVVEEELLVGKRQVERGGVRVNSSVSEQPVEERINLREEQVNIERHAVNRPVGEADLSAFKEGMIEITTTAEEAVVAKQARVVEEVVIDKSVQDRTETIRDTVRRTDVQVERIGTAHSAEADMQGYSAFDQDFRQHYKANLANTGYSYDEYVPVYQYGYNLSTDQRYQGSNWNTVEPDAQRGWEETNPGTWDQFKDSVHYSWEKARGKRQR